VLAALTMIAAVLLRPRPIALAPARTVTRTVAVAVSGLGCGENCRRLETALVALR
jgi:hypothetical protein